ncbi:MAG: sigma-70 family RNA polymerase sigma factor [Chitinivibrionales bacterium]|nr:sigma-70 family RNA polymerase sigma factor [Chitinivibrionales bacterium]MBD3356529.1 sigma-70 family RNA polymerase sigma factor [Chitinivibrionales bacterium]
MNSRTTLDRFSVDGSNLARYLKEIARNNALSTAEEAKLAVRIRTGDQAALERLIKANLRFVVSVARNYQGQGLPLADLINEGNLGLIRAAYRFDERKNFRFISYAVWWIRQAILSALAGQSRIMKLPPNRVGMIFKLSKAQERFEQKHNRYPDEHELAAEAGVSEAVVATTVHIPNRHSSLHEPLQSRGSAVLMDKLADDRPESPDDRTMRTGLRDDVEELLLRTLDSRERFVIRRYFGIGEDVRSTFEEIGLQANLTRERARQIKETAMKKLRNTTIAGSLKEYINGN